MICRCIFVQGIQRVAGYIEIQEKDQFEGKTIAEVVAGPLVSGLTHLSLSRGCACCGHCFNRSDLVFLRPSNSDPG